MRFAGIWESACECPNRRQRFLISASCFSSRWSSAASSFGIALFIIMSMQRIRHLPRKRLSDAWAITLRRDPRTTPQAGQMPESSIY
eukprot:3358059-Karenia_brevis.AAC.1